MIVRNVWRRGMAALVVVATVAVLAVALAGPARAALGNTGVPVHCYCPGSALASGGQVFLTCVSADGTAFAGDQRVPAARYLLVTDVLITPGGGSGPSAVTDLVFYDTGTTGRESTFRLRNTTTASYGYSFGVPYFVLYPDHRLEVTSSASSQASVDVKVTGLLVTNLTYLPLAVRQ